MSTVVDLDAVIADADREYPALYQLFGGYFHEDWRDESGTPDEAVRSFVRDAPPDAVAAARRELERLLAGGYDDGALTRVLEAGFGCTYAPAGDGIATTDWLASVRSLLGG